MSDLLKNKFVEAVKKSRDGLYIKSFEHISFPVLTVDAFLRDTRTEKLLSVLEKHQCKATFFVCGAWSEKYPQHIKKWDALGCETANHSFSHSDFTTLSFQEIVSEVTRTQELNQNASVNAKKYFRFPFGTFSFRELAIVKQMGYEVFLWNYDSFDVLEDGVRQVCDRLSDMKNGDIVLIHNDGLYTAEALDLFLTEREKIGKPVFFKTITEAIEAEKMDQQ